MTEDNRKELHFNLKLPDENQGGDNLAMKNMVMTIYNGRRLVFLFTLWSFILALLFGGIFLISQWNNENSMETTMELTMNYPGAEHGHLPNSEYFHTRIFFETEIWRQALDNSGLTNVSVSDAVGDVTISAVQQINEDDEEIRRPLTFEVVINSSSDVFPNREISERFLFAFARAFKDHLNAEYISPENVNLSWEHQLRAWQPIVLDEFCFRRNFDEIIAVYYAIERYLFLINESAPSFVSSAGNRFADLGNELREIRFGDLRTWSNRINNGIYIRNIDTFRSDSVFRAEALQINRNQALEKIELYNELLASFQQKDDIDGSIVWEAVSILATARGLVSSAADIGREIAELERNLSMLNEHEALFRTNANAAETAMQGFISDLENKLEVIGAAVKEYHNLENIEIAATSVLYTTPRLEQTTGGVSITRLAIVVVAPLLGGVSLGVFAAVVKSYLPEKPVKSKAKPQNKPGIPK